MRNDNRSTSVLQSTMQRPWLLAVALAFVIPACAPETDETVEGDFDTDEQMAERPGDIDRRTDDMADIRGEGSVQLSIEQSPTYGEYLVREDGRAVYLFTADTRGEASACYDACADAWPPVTGEAMVGSDLDESLIGTIERQDGTRQATYNGWPLYEFARDSGNQPTGQDIASFGGEWYLIGPDGEQIEAQGQATEGQNETPETTEGADQTQ